MSNNNEPRKLRRWWPLYVVVAAVVAGLFGVAGSTAQAATPHVVPPATAGAFTSLPDNPRLIGFPGTLLTANQSTPEQVTGLAEVPDGATGVMLDISTEQPVAAGALFVWTDEAGQPGSPAMTYGANEEVTQERFVGLNDAGRIRVLATTTTRIVVSVKGYTTPLKRPADVINQVTGIHTDTDGGIWQGGVQLSVGGSFSARKLAISNPATVTAGQWYTLTEDVTFHTKQHSFGLPQAYGTVEVDVAGTPVASRNGTTLVQEANDTISTIESDQQVTITFQAPTSGDLVTFAGGYQVNQGSDTTHYFATVQAGTLTALGNVSTRATVATKAFVRPLLDRDYAQPQFICPRQPCRF